MKSTNTSAMGRPQDDIEAGIGAGACVQVDCSSSSNSSSEGQPCRSGKDNAENVDEYCNSMMQSSSRHSDSSFYTSAEDEEGAAVIMQDQRLPNAAVDNEHDQDHEDLEAPPSPTPVVMELFEEDRYMDEHDEYVPADSTDNLDDNMDAVRTVVKAEPMEDDSRRLSEDDSEYGRMPVCYITDDDCEEAEDEEMSFVNEREDDDDDDIDIEEESSCNFDEEEDHFSHEDSSHNHSQQQPQLRGDEIPLEVKPDAITPWRRFRMNTNFGEEAFAAAMTVEAASSSVRDNALQVDVEAHLVRSASDLTLRQDTFDADEEDEYDSDAGNYHVSHGDSTRTAQFISARVIRKTPDQDIGFRIRLVEDTRSTLINNKSSLVISRINPDGLLAQSPILNGDKILSINNQSCLGMHYEGAVKLLKDATDHVTITVQNERGDASLVEW